MFSTNPYLILSSVSSVIIHSLSRNCFTVKNQTFISISKGVVIYINIAVTNVSNNIIKQYYSVIKMFKALVIVKKEQFSRTNIFI